MRYYAAIPFGGKAITGDIRTECSISEDLAEKIKKRFGACLPGKLATLSEKVLLQIRTTEPYKEVPVRYISEIIDCRCREIVEAILYYLQESGLQNAIRGGVVVTGGSAELTNFITLFKEMSGYDVRKGYPRYMFSASVGSGVYSTSATSAIGMVLAAKDDHLPDCVNVPEKVETPEEEMMEVEVTDETPAPDALFTPEEMGEIPEEEQKKKEKEKKVKKVKVPKPKKESTGFLNIVWKTVKGAALDMYDKANEE